MHYIEQVRMNVNIKLLDGGKLPEYKTIGAAGADCFARINEPKTIKPNELVTIPLGFAVEIPEGYELQVRGRSGLARKNAVQVFNSPGTIDSDYRGEVGAILHNDSNVDFIVNPGDRIAQAVVAPVIRAEWNLVSELSDTERGEGGFGSTGVSGEIKVNYPNNVEKFYEPFKTIGDADEVIAKEVIIDGKYKAIVESIFFKDTAIGKKPFVTFRYKAESGTESIITDDMDFVTAFERATIDGHRFGREMEFKEK